VAVSQPSRQRLRRRERAPVKESRGTHNDSDRDQVESKVDECHRKGMKELQSEGGKSSSAEPSE
jgi:hypothetical protein